MKKWLINTSLYRARLKKGVSVKEAAKGLTISSLRLSLIEHGYLNVPKRKFVRFIDYYKLPKNFFETHSTFVEPYEKDEIDFKDLNKKAKKLAKRKVRIFSYVSIFTSLCCVAFGLYANNRRYISPRLPWTETFTKFIEKVRSEPDEQKVSIIDGDDYYKMKGSENEIIIPGMTDTYTCSNSVTVYGKDFNSSNTNIDSLLTKRRNGVAVTVSTYYLFASNKKKVIYMSYTGENSFMISLATIVVSKDNSSFELRPFQYSTDVGKTYQIGKKGSDVYKNVEELLKVELPVAFESIDTSLLAKKGLYYTSANALLNDVQKISRDYVLFSRLGLSFIVVFSFTAICFVLLLCLSCYSSYRIRHPVPKLSKETKEILNYEMPTKEKLDDIRYPSFLPEFSLRSLGLLILFLSSFALFGTVYILFEKSFLGITDIKPLKSATSNFLSAAVLLLFFIKLDVYYRKNASQLLKNIIVLFIAGLIFYIAELLLFSSILKAETVFSIIIEAIKDIVPGNVIWNIMLYSLIFYFLFTTPRKFLNDATKVIKWRLCSLIPTFVLIFALFYKFFFESKLGTNAIYISLIFHTSGIIPTLFAILYLYSLYFFNLINKFNYGVKDAEVYSYSRRYALQKNMLASIIIVLLFALDMFFKYNDPDNRLKLGKNWAIILLVPIILLYRPHIGKRVVAWDNIYVALYGAFFAGGYISIAIYILSKINITDLIYIRF